MKNSRANQISRFAWLMPSASDIAFLFPMVILFVMEGGTRWLLCDSDTGWHIRAGEWIIAHHQIPKSDLFSFTLPGKPWFPWEWLSDVAMGWLHRSGGLAAVVVGSVTILCATAVSIYRNVRSEAESRLVALVVCWLCLTASSVHWIARPHLATFLMTSLFCGVLNDVEKRRDYRPLVFLPAGMLLWVNLHGGFVVGLVMPFLYAVGAAVEELIESSVAGRFTRSRMYVIAGSGCVAASFVNPFFYRLHVHVATYLADGFYWNRVVEFQSIDFHALISVYFESLLIVSICAVFYHLSRGRMIPGIVGLFWAHYALFASRNIPVFAAVAGPGIGLAITEWIPLVVSLKRAPGIERIGSVLRNLQTGLEQIATASGSKSLHVVPCLSILALTLSLHPSNSVRGLRPVFDEARFPVKAANVLEATLSSPNVRVYADWQWGGYLIYRFWPRARVFNDGRTDFYGSAFSEQGIRLLAARPGWEKTLEKFEVGSALLPVDCSLTAVLRQRTDWRVIYEDGFAIFFQKVPPNFSSR